MIEKAPLRFHPYFKTVIWGGDKIGRYKGISRLEPNVGESWEISAVPGHESVVAEGSYEGLNIVELIERFGSDILGSAVVRRYNGRFPLLIKFIDANDNLSVQVHPDDSLAMERHGSLGKTEMWYIIESEKGARIYSGLNRRITAGDYLRLVADDEFQNVLAEHEAGPGDVFFLPAGRVHAIGAGNLLAEIQESSDITYRIYDYGRRDASGNTRELHTEQAKDAIDYEVYENYKSPRPKDDPGRHEIARCEHFVTHRINLNGDMTLPLCGESFTVIICVAGEAKLRYPGGESPMKAGETVLIPAAMSSLSLSGQATLLTTHC